MFLGFPETSRFSRLYVSVNNDIMFDPVETKSIDSWVLKIVDLLG